MSATERRAELDQAVNDAKAAEHRLRDQQREAQGKAAELARELATRPAGEFDDHGVPKPKTTARRLKDQVDAATSNLWGERIKVAEADTKAATVAYARFTSDNLIDLVHEREAGDVQAVVDLDDALAGVERAVRNLHARARAHADLMRGVTGLDVRRELPSYDSLNGLMKLVKAARGNVRPPVPMSVSPQPGETPNRVLVDGQWTSPGEPERRARRERERAQQREREQRRNARLRRAEFDVRPEPQKPPGMSETEWVLHGLLGG